MSRFKRIKGWLKRRLLLLLVIFMGVVLVLLFFAPKMVITIYPGEAGVLFRRIGNGTVTHKHYTEGITIIPPWDLMYIYDVRLHEESQSFRVLTNDGLTVDVSVSVRFSPNIHTLGTLHKLIGPNYVEKVIFPEVAARTKNIISSYDLEQLYVSDRGVIQDSLSNSILDGINDQVLVDSSIVGKNDIHENKESYIIFEDLFITDIQLPKTVSQQIEAKIVAEQKYMTYAYILLEEKEEAKRKQIEAAGIDSFQTISKIPILKWRGLQATEKLAESPNSKLVILGTDQDLPILLNGDVPDPPKQ